MQQTAGAVSQEYRSPLKTHGHDVSFGDVGNILFNHDLSNDLTFSFRFTDRELESLIRGRLLNEFQDYLIEIMSFWQYEMISADSAKSVDRSNDIRKMHEVRTELRREKSSNDFDSIESALNTLSEVLSTDDLTRFENRRPSPFGVYRRSVKRRSTKRFVNIDELRNAATVLHRLRSISARTFSIKVEMATSVGEQGINRLTTRSLSLDAGELNLISLRFPRANRPIAVDSSFLLDGEKDHLAKDLQGCVDIEAPIFRLFRADLPASDSYVRDIIVTLLSRALSSVESSFQNGMVNHVTPLRAYPKRYYFLDVAAPGGVQGDSLIELLRENTHLREKVNAWLRRFGLKIDVEQFREIIHRLTVRRDNVDFDMDITDVGFGMSQILPVIAQVFLARPQSLTIIEQPEIHLHPNMQADLGDLFISAIQEGRVSESPARLLIETHSEYLLNRVRRRVAEGVLSSSDVAIYSVERMPQSQSAYGGSRVTPIEMNSKGAFEWPMEFFEETLEDTLQFLELQ